jgi:Sporulation and spore germination
MLAASIAVAVVAGVAIRLVVSGVREPAAPAAARPAAPSAAPAEPARTIKARLFYVGEEGTRLVGIERDVPYGEGTVEQARQIVEAEIAPAGDQLSPIPTGTELKAIFVTPKGEAYLDLSRAVSDAHPGGTTDELLTVYALVDALTVNVPAITSVQILVDGKEAETLAGHVDLRRPLAQNLDWVQ